MSAEDWKCSLSMNFKEKGPLEGGPLSGDRNVYAFTQALRCESRPTGE